MSSDASCPLRSGVRALPPRTHAGAVPLAGRLGIRISRRSTPDEGAVREGRGGRSAPAASLPGPEQQTGAASTQGSLTNLSASTGSSQPAPGPTVWVVCGLGARGAFYHAWLGRQVARAVVADDEGEVDEGLRGWQSAEAQGRPLVFEGA